MWLLQTTMNTGRSVQLLKDWSVFKETVFKVVTLKFSQSQIHSMVF
jgi:hypothetical protein